MAALADVLIHSLRCLPFAESLVMVECAVSRGDMTLDFLRCRLPGKRNGPARDVLRWVDRGAESLLETLARTHFRQAGIRVETQVYLDKVGYMDLLLDGWLVGWTDGITPTGRRSRRTTAGITSQWSRDLRHCVTTTRTWCTRRRTWWRRCWAFWRGTGSCPASRPAYFREGEAAESAGIQGRWWAEPAKPCLA